MEHDGDMMDGDMMDGGTMDMMAGMMGLWMVLWAVIGLALLALVIVATVWLAKRMSPDRSPSGAEVDEILRRRYAAGEISQEDYLRIREDLSRR